ncbi:hypothetical protein DDZ18_11545 [Marinicauda salina]|uniref:Phytase-like domain-containing protein n=1 Tax=Marinicauda salina TaxID=2135793 RepID=A0A2U2BS44_9PROT|nr:esterase-like activity of phytase family protein [Marinicauda salina]PWE16819.1 hypothetical protein DDZ18_11545 [Marinicauda salina]
MIRLAAVFAPGLLFAAACEAGEAEIAVSAAPVPLFPDAPEERALDGLRYAGGLELASDHDLFGGWSAIEISPDGNRLLAASDRGAWLTARLDYDARGDLAGVSDVEIAPMLGPDGTALSGNAADAEGLAALGEGRVAVSFERDHRLAVYDPGADWSGIAEAVPEPLPAPPGADRLRSNGGLEALAVAGGGLWAGVEYPIIDGQTHTVWRYDLADLSVEPVGHSLRLALGFGLTGMAEAGDGDLVIVERFWARETGARILINRAPTSLIREDGANFSDDGPTRLARLDPEMTVDNFEGAAIARIDGRERLFLISDDNFSADQRTLLMSFEFAEAPAAE